MEDKIFNMQFSLNELNVILGMLSQGPYATVEPIIKKIQSQAESQIQTEQSKVPNL